MVDGKESPLPETPAELLEELQRLKASTQDQFTQHPVQSAHPWAVFLEARREVVEWMMSDGLDAAAIARALSMDPGQVRLIHQSTVERAADRTIRARSKEVRCGS